MDAKICLFCDSEYGDPMQPAMVDKVAALCHLTSNKHQLIDRKICMRYAWAKIFFLLLFIEFIFQLCIVLMR